MTEQDMAALWRKLTNNQRIYLMNQAVPYHQQVAQSHTITAGRALERHGLSYNRCPKNRALAEWAIEHGYARQNGPPQRARFPGHEPVATWTFSTPEAEPKGGRVDPDRLTELAAAGHYAADIAKQLGVSRQAIASAAKRHGLTLAPKPRKPKPAQQPRVPRPERLVFNVSTDELAAIRRAAAQRGIPVSTYLRDLCAADATPSGDAT